MTAYEVITLADELAPNVFSNAVKLFELNRLEQRIRVDILKENPENVTLFTESDLSAPTDSGPLASVDDQREDGGGSDAGREDGAIGDGSGDAGGSGGSGGSGGGDEIEDPGTGQETGEGDPAGEGSGEGSGSSGGSEGSGEGSGSSEGSGEGSGSSEGSGEGSGDNAGSGSGSGSDSGSDSEDEDEPAGTLALEERYRDVYVFWMVSMYYYHMGEYEEYQNKKAMFEQVWTRFVRDVCYARHPGTGGPEYT